MKNERKSAHAASGQSNLVGAELEARVNFVTERIKECANVARDTQEQLDRLFEDRPGSYLDPQWLEPTEKIESYEDKAERYWKRAKLYEAELDKLLRATHDEDGSDGTDKSAADSTSGEVAAFTGPISSALLTEKTKDTQ